LAAAPPRLRANGATRDGAASGRPRPASDLIAAAGRGRPYESSGSESTSGIRDRTRGEAGSHRPPRTPPEPSPAGRPGSPNPSGAAPMFAKVVLPLLAAAGLGFAVFSVVQAGAGQEPTLPLIPPPTAPEFRSIAGAGLV